ncbi:MAG: SPFH domain-containing protein [Gemmataceae bacterium]|nr:SPFH domain-containing protein [Gemmataceae bacterium]
MLGIRYVKAAPTVHVLHFVGGRIRRSGPGLSFFCFSPWSTIVAVPAGSMDGPFMITETTADFQDITVQGSLAYRVSDPVRLAGLLDYSQEANGQYSSDDPDKLVDRVTQAAQTALRPEIQRRKLREALLEAEAIADHVHSGLRESPVLSALGIEVLDFSILAIRPTPETAKALEARAREEMLREADDAIYARRNNAVEQERVIKENELNTELAVEAKQRELEEGKLEAEIELEGRRQVFVEREAANIRTRAEAQAFAVEATLKPLAALDPRALQVLAARSTDPRHMVALGFQEIASNAEKIGTLNISPDLLDSLLRPSRRDR